MGPVNIFSIASEHNRWLAVRQTTVAQNIANANTPGYKSMDVEPFEATLASTRLQMATTRESHMIPTGALAGRAEAREDQSWQVVHSGNTVSLEQQLMKSSEVTGAYSLNTSAIKAFHRMLLASSRG
jgi:flagellar basal-body rod protein FlgB